MHSTNYQILNHSNEAFLIECIESGKIEFANAAAAEMLQLSTDKLCGAVLEHLIRPFSLPGSLSGWRRHSTFFTLQENRVKGDEKYKLIKLHKVDEPVTRHDIQNLERVSKVLVHRLRSPLSAIGGFFELIKPDGSQYVAEAEAIEQGIRQIEQILSRIKSFEELPSPSREPVDIGVLVSEIKRALPPKNLRNIEWKMDVQNVVRLDRDMLKKVLLILIENAIDAVDGTFEQITVVLQKKDHFTLTVRNFGEPIIANHLPLLFKPFFTTKAKNTGLGLTKAYLLVKAMGGFIYISENSSIDGICFKVVV